MPREELRCFEALLRNAPQHDGVTFSRSWNAIIGSRYSDQPVVQTGQSRLHNFKDDEHARALWGAYACSKHRYSVADTRICLGLANRSGRSCYSPPSPRLRRTNLPGFAAKVGGADRDRTDDLKLAKLALSQLSYGPRNRFNLACQAEAAGGSPSSPQRAPTRQPSLLRSTGWWARDELNVRPHAYQACALTT